MTFNMARLDHRNVEKAEECAREVDPWNSV